MRAGKGGTYREVPVHPQLRPDLALWINDERPAWKGVARTSALLLNHRGARLGARGADGILGAIADEAHLTDEFTTHVLRHTFGTTLERRGVASDAMFRVRREDGAVGATGPGATRRPSLADRANPQARTAVTGQCGARCHDVASPLWCRSDASMMRQEQRKSQRQGQMPLPACRPANPFSIVGKPLPTSFRQGHDLVLVAELMGHKRLDQTRRYSLPTQADRERAIGSLPSDH